MSKPYKIGTKVKIGKTQKGIIRDVITYKNGTRDYKVLIHGKGIKIISSKRIKRIKWLELER